MGNEETGGKNERRVLGGGAKRWNDKHVTQNGNNYRPHVRVRASHAALDDTHLNTQLNTRPAADVMMSGTEAFQDFHALSAVCTVGSAEFVYL